ncbi:DsrE family protein [Spirosoma spitsbergense]|jgi:intracellular sulfur oxidation DsrE/DsrF family protein|uniref:DsrE family protein n=1 Tax=Spirosoma spitsbergense TaxID=431554 RepID=UPI0003732184|nr:DsrE family protein [Spirosoma spitsbergense]
MKTILLLTVSFLMTAAITVNAQKKPAEFHGATPTKAHYQVVYQLNTDDDGKIKGTLRNIQNALDDPRLKGKLEVELVVHGAGVAVYRTDKPYEELVKGLQSRGVILAMCENTMRERKIDKKELFPFVSYVPSGNGELILRQQEGWAIMHP